MKQNELLSIDTLLEYLDELKNVSKYLVIICIRDTAGFWLNEDIQKKLYALGLKENLIKKLMVGYIAVIENGYVIHEVISEKDGMAEYNTEKIHVISRPFSNGDIAVIEINNVDYATNKRGLNIVVWDLENEVLIDSVAFDTHVKEFTKTRKVILGKSHYDVCLVGCWYGSNYGSLLNGYAVYQILKGMNLDVLMLNKHTAKKGDWEIYGTHNEKFIKNFYPTENISPVIPFSQLGELNRYCDTFLAGSDQIWAYGINRIFDLAYMLNFVDDNKRKISFASSFGHEDDGTPADKYEAIRNLLHRFNAISVREQSGVRLCHEKYGVKATLVLEPVFCVNKQVYQDLEKHSHIVLDEPYILSYILDPTEEKRDAINYYAKASGKKAINILDGDPRVYEKNRRILNLPNTLDPIGAEDFIKLFIHADFIITDSFHGTAFSIIFEKSFLAISNPRRGSVRFKDILERFNLISRLTDSKNIQRDEKNLEKINFSEANKVIIEERARSIEWLRKVLFAPLERLTPKNNCFNTVTTKGNGIKCTGCSACINICPVNALELKPNNLGYYTPSLDVEKCINCGKCIKICPEVNLPPKENSFFPKCYEFITADKDILFKSSSGGAFSCLAKEAFRKDGIVVGASWNEKYDAVEHVLIESENDLDRLRKSKYLQSYLGTTFKEIKKKLNEGIFVLFTGCPCQVAGLKAFLGKDYINLISVDLLCGNAPSTLFYQKYVEDEVPGILKKYEFRHKKNGWNSDCVTIAFTITTTTTTEVRRGGAQDGYQRLYHNHTMCPPHCENCKYQNLPRYGDITIGDFWWIKERDQAIDEKNGVSAVLCNNEKGQNFFDSILENEIKVKKEVPVEWLKGNGFVPKGRNWCSPQRDAFYDAIQKMPFSKAADFALKPNHGIYEVAFSSSHSPLQYNSESLHFKFDSAFWEEHFINGATVLMVKPGQSKQGRFSRLSFCKELEKGKNYELAIGFRINTESDVINFHIKDSGSNIWQLVYSKRLVSEERNGRKKICIITKFVPESGIFDEFMISAAHLKGEDNYIAFEYINIQEVNQ